MAKIGLTADKLPSGSWRVRTHGRTFTGKDKKAVIAQAMEYKLEVEAGKKTPSSAKTLGDLVKEYIADHSTTDTIKGLSPSTIAGYEKIKRNMFLDLQKMRCQDITKSIAQKSIRAHQKTKAPKYIVNSWNLMHRAATYYGEELPTVDLPTVQVQDLTWVQKRHLGAFLEAIKGDSCEVPMLLGLHGLRTSEIYGLRWENIDLDKGVIYIRGAKVRDENHELVFKPENKNATSQRTVPILIQRLAELLQAMPHDGEFVVTNGQTTIRSHLASACEAIGIEPVSMHGLRRSFASLARSTLDEATTMKIGGWSTPNILKRTYQRMDEQELIEEAKGMADFFSNL